MGQTDSRQAPVEEQKVCDLAEDAVLQAVQMARSRAANNLVEVMDRQSMDEEGREAEKMQVAAIQEELKNVICCNDSFCETKYGNLLKRLFQSALVVYAQPRAVEPQYRAPRSRGGDQLPEYEREFEILTNIVGVLQGTPSREFKQNRDYDDRDWPKVLELDYWLDALTRDNIQLRKIAQIEDVSEKEWYLENPYSPYIAPTRTTKSKEGEIDRKRIDEIERNRKQIGEEEKQRKQRAEVAARKKQEKEKELKTLDEMLFNKLDIDDYFRAKEKEFADSGVGSPECLAQIEDVAKYLKIAWDTELREDWDSFEVAKRKYDLGADSENSPCRVYGDYFETWVASVLKRPHRRITK